MLTGDTVPKVKYLQTLGGRALSYSNKAAFNAGGWDVVWYDNTNTILSSQPTYTVADMGAGRHMISHTVPSGFAVAKFTVPAIGMDPGTWALEGQAYDEDSLAGLLQTSQGVIGVRSAADGDLGDVVSGDAWNSDILTIPLGRISVFGYTDLTGMTVTAGFKKDPTTTSVTTGAGVTATIVSAANRTVTVAWDTFPTTMLLPVLATSDLSQQWYCDVALKHTASGRLITGYRFKLNVVWQRDLNT